MDNFKPTWLYIKEHNDTGMKYFGKTVNDPDGYSGSGLYWVRHIKKHSNNVTTVWKKQFTDEQELIEYALNFSTNNNIVESREWANLKQEDGQMGGDTGISEAGRKILSEKGLKRKHSEESKQKIRDARAKQVMPSGWKMKEEQKEKLRVARAKQVMPKRGPMSEEQKEKCRQSQLARWRKLKGEG